MATYHYIQQRSREWFQLRLGMPTGSEFEKLITPKKLEVSTQCTAYMYRLLAEWVLGEAIVTDTDTKWMQRGRDEEAAAIKAFEFQTDLETAPIGFVTTDDAVMGCSPDRLVGDDGVLEIKCASAQVHVGYLLGSSVAEDYLIQTQAQLLITERQRGYVFAYHPKLPPSLIKIERDQKVIDAIDRVVRTFHERMHKYREDWVQRFGQPIREEPKSSDLGGLGITDEMVAWFESDARFQ